MTRVISIHQYQLQSDVSDHSFIQAVEQAQSAKLFDLTGLESYHFMKGIKGTRQGQWTAVWIYSSRSAWENLWGTPTDPQPKSAYPEPWQRWENDILAPLLTGDPDRIKFTSYEEVISSTMTPEGRNE
jgi:hypothetical protein